MKISFIIPAYNEEKYLGDCLESIIKYGPADAEIIVVDNASTDKTAEVARQFPQIWLLSETNKGVTKARQTGLMASAHELVAFIDADCRLTDSWPALVEKKFQDNPRLIGLSGPYIYQGFSPLIQFLTAHFWNHLMKLTSVFTGYVIMGGNFIAKKKPLLQSGGFNAHVPFYGDEAELGRRLRRLGKIKFAVNLNVLSSPRRFQAEGAVRLALKYALNYFWVVIFKKPFHLVYKDIR